MESQSHSMQHKPLVIFNLRFRIERAKGAGLQSGICGAARGEGIRRKFIEMKVKFGLSSENFMLSFVRLARV